MPYIQRRFLVEGALVSEMVDEDNAASHGAEQQHDVVATQVSTIGSDVLQADVGDHGETTNDARTLRLL